MPDSFFILAHAPSFSLVVLAGLHMLSVPLAMVSAFLLGWPDKRRVGQGLAWVALMLALPVLVVVPWLPGILGRDGAVVIGMLLVSPAISVWVLVKWRRWR
jgi:hypothetical protein